ncbi:ATP-dependent RNA helicase [Dirofilaria immitis]
MPAIVHRYTAPLGILQHNIGSSCSREGAQCSPAHLTLSIQTKRERQRDMVRDGKNRRALSRCAHKESIEIKGSLLVVNFRFISGRLCSNSSIQRDGRSLTKGSNGPRKARWMYVVSALPPVFLAAPPTVPPMGTHRLDRLVTTNGNIQS